MKKNPNYFPNLPDILTVSDLQKAFGIGRNAAYKLVNSNQIKSFRIGQSIRIPKVWIIDFIQGCNETIQQISDGTQSEREVLS